MPPPDYHASAPWDGLDLSVITTGLQTCPLPHSYPLETSHCETNNRSNSFPEAQVFLLFHFFHCTRQEQSPWLPLYN